MPEITNIVELNVRNKVIRVLIIITCGTVYRRFQPNVVSVFVRLQNLAKEMSFYMQVSAVIYI